jgi:hypothetical protein
VGMRAGLDTEKTNAALLVREGEGALLLGNSATPRT